MEALVPKSHIYVFHFVIVPLHSVLKELLANAFQQAQKFIFSDFT